ncbi:recombination protein 2 [Thalassotalea profundi]|uniref:Recombination protein 2 n=2 Tax=Thalassotalea profundi TaxID=2036687 RepID=A0ABQ3IE88_9GAMM|nr:recombination protein 2 [Thalassotalea profundi]
MPSCIENYCRFNFIAQQLNNTILNEPVVIKLNWNSPKTTLKQGQQWQLFVKLKPAHGLANPGGFSYQTWLRRQNVHATGYVREKQENQLLNKAISHRQKQFSSFNQALPSHDLTPIIQALTFGERSGLDKRHWKVLQNTQIQHLIAISGLHIGIVGGVSYLVFLIIIRLLPLNKILITHSYIISKKSQAKSNALKNKSLVNTCLNNNIRIFALLFSAICAGYYAYLAGFSVPTLRALVMIYWFLIFRLLAIKVAIHTWFALSVFCIVLLMPMSVISISFWLSIYAVLCIFIIIWLWGKYFTQYQLADVSFWHKFIIKAKQLLLLQSLLTLLMLPLATLFSGQVSIVAILANIIAVPLVSLVVLPLIICALLVSQFSAQLTSFIIDIVLMLLSWLWQYLTFLSELPWAVSNLTQLQWGLLSIAILLILLAIFVTPNIRKWLLFPLVLVIANIKAYSVFSTNSWQVKVMDVGQGLAVIVEKNNRVLLYDTGAKYPSGFSMAESVLLPYFQQQGIEQLDWLIISHDDNDHAGGFNLLNNSLLIENLMVNDLNINANYRCLAGAKYNWQGLTIEVLSPNEMKGDKNDDSCVVRISDQQHSVLLPGDISQKIERRIVKQFSTHDKVNTTNESQKHQQLASTIIIAPHHGSKTSSSRPFLQAVSPQYAVFSAGFLNHWYMPAKTVVERYHKLNISTFNTAESGTVTFKISNKGIEVSQYRLDEWPFWFAN